MATILKCKICGGDISVNADMTVGICQYCGTTITLPRIDSDKKARLFNRANQYRLNCEFDKAYDAYNAIVSEDEQEAEAYWGMVLSEYGVEYVEVPSTKKRIPTCHRTLTHSVQSTVNYDYACKFADPERKLMYQDEAEELDRIQKKILSVSSKETPYDVFICYKETNVNGERTEDSVIAQDIFSELEKEGLKVFFARITLSDKLGSDYEPYIYSALKTSKVMLVIGTSNENLNSVWVKNEWSRFISFMKEETGKTIIPVYKNMNIYELPDALNRYQAQDLSKIGAIQDLVYSVSKIVKREVRANKDIVIDSLIKEKIEREKKAAAFANKKAKALGITKQVARIIIVMAVLITVIVMTHKLYTSVIYPNYTYSKAQKQMKDGDYDNAIETYRKISNFKDGEDMIIEAKYQKALTLLDEEKYDEAISAFKDIRVSGGYKNVDEEYKRCIYEKANYLMSQEQYVEAFPLFTSVIDYSDAKSRNLECVAKLISQELEKQSASESSSYDTAGEYLDKLKHIETDDNELKKNYINYYNSLLCAVKYDHELVLNNTYDSYSDYVEHMADAQGVFYCDNNKKYVVLNSNGMVYLTAITSRIQELGIQSLIENVNFCDGGFTFYYLPNDDKYYVQYNNTIRYEISFSNDNKKCFVTQQNKRIHKYYEKYEQFPGEYIKVV